MNKNKKLRLIKELKEMSDNPNFFAKDGEEFEGDKNCVIWTGAEEGWKDGIPLADYYEHNDHPEFKKWLKKNKLSYEWQDPGTIMIYED